ncbi:MAG: LamG domain-containing protein [Planctomycetales bacterium]
MFLITGLGSAQTDHPAVVVGKEKIIRPLTDKIVQPLTLKEGAALPSYLRGATALAFPKRPGTSEKNGVIEFKVVRGGLLYLVAEYAYQGNSGGGWTKTRLTKEQLIEKGWEYVEPAPWGRKCSIFRRIVKQGEQYTIRSNKYWPPEIIMPASRALGTSPKTVPQPQPANGARSSRAIPPVASPIQEPRRIRLPAPTQDQQAAILKLVRDVYEEAFATANSSAKKAALAKRLLQTATETKDDAAAQFVLFKQARELAVEGGDVATALESVLRLAESFEVDSLKLQTDALEGLAGTAKFASQRTRLVESGIALMDQAVKTDQYEIAERLGTVVLAVVRKTGNSRLNKEVTERIAETKAMADRYAEAKPAFDVLERMPADPDANLIAGRYVCFIKGDWAAGLPMLSLGTDRTLKELAKADLGRPQDAVRQVEVADGWWKVAEAMEGLKADGIRRHAARWYVKTLPTLKGLAKLKIEKRLEAIGPIQDAKPSDVATVKAAPTLKIPKPVLAINFDADTRFLQAGKPMLRNSVTKRPAAIWHGGSVAKGIIGDCISLNGKQFVELNSFPTIEGNGPRTIAAYVKTKSKSAGAIVCLGGSDEAKGFTLLVRNERPPGINILGAMTGGGTAVTDVGKNVGDERWHFVAVTFDGKTGIRFYVDGQLDQSVEHPLKVSGHGNFIGRTTMQSWALFQGLIDEVAVWDKCLSAEMIRDIHAASMKGQSYCR